MKKVYSSVDIVKFLSAILVITIHTNPLISISESANYFLVSVLARLAVPFFFVCSGFFLAEKIPNKIYDSSSRTQQWLVVVKYIKKIAIVYLIWSIIYLPYNIFKWGTQFNWSKSYILTYVKNFIFDGSYYILWFLPALIFAVPCAVFLYNKCSTKVSIAITLFFYIIGVLGQSYFDLLPNNIHINNVVSIYDSIFITTRNGLFFGLPFVYMGLMINKNKKKINTSKKVCLNMTIIFFIILIVEVFSLRDLDFTRGNGMWLSLIPLIYFLFMYLLKVEIRDKKIFRKMRQLSLYMYVSHGVFIIVYASIISKLFPNHSLIEFSFVLLGSYYFSKILLKLKEYR